MASTYVEYQFPFRDRELKMAGRPSVASDSAIINMVFQRDMFGMAQWQQTKALNQYFVDRCNSGFQPLLIDAGANIGAASLYFNQLYPRLKTIAIEPDHENAQLASHNLNGLDAQVIEAALAREAGVLYINDVDFAPIAYRVGATGNKPVQALTIPSLLSSIQGDYFPFILKIDIEGGEDALFAQAAPWLDQFALVVIELHDWMLPFQNASRNFYRNISAFDFDLLNQGENTFCFNKRLLAR